MANVSIIFEEKPEQWGLRGDPFLWDELKTAFSSVPIPCSRAKFVQLFENYFREFTKHPFSHENEYIYVEKYSHGGMSSGYISYEFWKRRAIPLLIDRLDKLNSK